MDAAQIAAMIADREAGTPGPWKVFYTQDGGSVIGIGDSEGSGVTDPQFGLWRSGKERISNASRIARVPDMESTILAQAAELERLREAVKRSLQYIPQSTVECRGDKCREPWCISCYGEEHAERAMLDAADDATFANAALKGGAA